MFFFHKVFVLINIYTYVFVMRITFLLLGLIHLFDISFRDKIVSFYFTSS